MLKSTYKPAVAREAASLPEGWTEHKAPTGHTYYHNATTQASTYERPRLEQATPDITSQFSRLSGGFPGFPQSAAYSQKFHGAHIQGRSNGRNGYERRGRPEPRDRPRSKHGIPGCEPWLLVKTKLGRRFVYHPARNESFWKFPPDVMKGVVEFDRQDREKRQKLEQDHSIGGEAEEDMTTATEERISVQADMVPGAAPRPPSAPQAASNDLGSDEEYEEVEVTDDEGGIDPAEREKLGDEGETQPVEFGEDDIAEQLAAMGQDYGLDPGEYGNESNEELEDGAEGLALTEADAKALFKDMLGDHHVSPYTTWEAILEAGQIIEDDRYTVLPNMRARKDIWAEWSRDMVQRLREAREKEEKKDPRIPYFAILQARATPKLYWPEFRRKFQKEPELRNSKLSDKDREKWYREYINRLKLPESRLKSDLIALMKSIPLRALNRATTLENLPSPMLTDLKFISLRSSVRDALILAHISSLQPPPTQVDLSPAEEESRSREEKDREKRNQALAERQRRVAEEKKSQRGALQYSRSILKEGEDEIQRAMKLGKDGLLSHMEKG